MVWIFKCGIKMGRIEIRSSPGVVLFMWFYPNHLFHLPFPQAHGAFFFGKFTGFHWLPNATMPTRGHRGLGRFLVCDCDCNTELYAKEQHIGTPTKCLLLWSKQRNRKPQPELYRSVPSHSRRGTFGTLSVSGDSRQCARSRLWLGAKQREANKLRSKL